MQLQTQVRADLRNRARQRRDSLPPHQIAIKSEKIADTLLQIVESKRLKVIMLYLNMGSEVRTIPLVHQLLSAGRIALAPVMKPASRKLLPYRIINPDTDLILSKYGMLQPDSQHCQFFAPQKIDLVIVPGIAFDARGYRIGYGGGYYDRFLKRCPQAMWVGLAFELQIIPDVFPEAWDIPVQQIITEERVIICERIRNQVF